MIQRSTAVTTVKGCLSAVSVRNKQGPVRVELHRSIVVGVGRRTPVLHKSNTVCIGVCERPVTTRAVFVHSDIDLQPFQDGVLLAEGLTVDGSLTFTSPVVASVYSFYLF